VVAPYDGYENVRINVEYESEAERGALLDAAEDAARSADGDLVTIDGFRVDYGDAWVLVRPSGTEPVVRIYAEGRDEDRAKELADWMAGVLWDAKTDA
jgi:phosphomannomutase/phosphoglucomutase